MNGNVMYEVARLRIADLHRTARQARLAREAAHARRARKAAPESIAMPVIPDFAEEMFAATGDTVPAPRPENPRGRHARSGR